MQEDEVLGKAYDSRLMRRLIMYLRPYKRYVVLALALILLESSLEVTFPWLTKIAIDRYIAAANIAGLAAIAIEPSNEIEKAALQRNRARLVDKPPPRLEVQDMHGLPTAVRVAR